MESSGASFLLELREKKDQMDPKRFKTHVSLQSFLLRSGRLSYLFWVFLRRFWTWIENSGVSRTDSGWEGRTSTARTGPEPASRRGGRFWSSQSTS